MLLLGHSGITLGAAWVAVRLSRRPRSSGKAPRPLAYAPLLVGALLPDLVDKLGYLLFRDVLSASRTIGHALLFGLVLLLAGWFLRRRGPSWLLLLALASLGHLVLDEMWQAPHTLLWPLLGWGFDKVPFEEWFPTLWIRLGNLRVLVPELVGAGIILALVASALLARARALSAGRQ